MTEHEAALDVRLDPQSLKALAHPLRVRLLGLLREDGPSTATKLAERLGQSSGATSYHLRQLAIHGFVVEDEDQSSGGRERWWRSAHVRTILSKEQVRNTPVEAEGFLRAVAADAYRHIESFVAELPTLPSEWDDASMVSDVLLRLTCEEATALRRDLLDLVERYREDVPGAEPPPDAERIILQIQLMPQLRGSEPENAQKEN
jgi:DNA-binding transcriptional ArsR family regulator